MNAPRSVPGAGSIGRLGTPFRSIGGAGDGCLASPRPYRPRIHVPGSDPEFQLKLFPDTLRDTAIYIRSLRRPGSGLVVIALASDVREPRSGFLPWDNARQHT